MVIFSKRCLLPLFFSVCICLVVFWPDQVVRAAEVDSQSIYAVSVEVKLDNGNNYISLNWRSVPPANDGAISYEIQKSTDGGLNFDSVAKITVTTWTDNNGGNGVPNYTNVIYRLRSIETVGGIIYESSFSSPVNVFLPNVNVHDNYMSNTNLCSTCHSTHTAEEAKLLNKASDSAFCITCHAGSTNSKYDVNSGYTMTAGGITRSLGGAFENDGGNPEDPWGGAATTSAHGEENGSIPMECTNCHSAHGTGNYRMLKGSTNGDSIVAGAKADNPNLGETPVYISGIESFCQSCHAEAKFVSGGSGHPLNIALGALTTSLPLEGTITDRADHTDKMMCLTCHYSHGSTSGNLTVSLGNNLCFKCHTTNTERTSGFSNDSQLNLHNSTGSAGGHLDCSSCHVSHGEFSKGLLIGGGNPITSIDSESGTSKWYYDSCATSCHRPGSGA